MSTYHQRFKTLEERFWEKADKRGPIPKHQQHLGECWLWTAGKNKLGYGRIKFRHHGRKENYAHRASWAIHFGDFDKDLDVCHHCDCRMCIRPSHLFLATQRENNADKVKKGRQSKGTKHSKTIPKGENHPYHKLTDSAVRQIRKLSGMISQREMAKRFNVCQSVISDVIIGATWKHVH